MITKYLGDFNGLLECQEVGFVESNVQLSEDNISDYTKSFAGFSRHSKFVTKAKLTDKVGDSYDAFYCEDFEPNFRLSHLVFYDIYSNPIGFITLDSVIDIDQYGIKRVILRFNYNIKITTVNLSYDLNYKYHQVKTDNHQAHLGLFDDQLNAYRAVKKDNVLGTYSHRRKFTKNIKDLFRTPSIGFRYSGNIGLRKKTNQIDTIGRLVDESVTITKSELLDDKQFVDIIEVDNNRYLVFWSLDQSVLVDSSNPDHQYVLNLRITNPYYIGSNMLISTEGEECQVYLIKSILENDNDPLGISYIERSKGLVLSNDLRICKDPFSKVLLFYRLNRNKVESVSETINHNLRYFNNVDFSDSNILFTSEGFLVLGDFDKCFDITNIRIYTYSLPFDNTRRYGLSYDDAIIQKVTEGSNINWFIPVTRDLIYVKGSNGQFLAENKFIDFDDKGYINSELVTYPIQGRYKYKNLSTIARNFDYRLMTADICDFSLNGSLYRVNETTNTYVISRL